MFHFPIFSKKPSFSILIYKQTSVFIFYFTSIDNSMLQESLLKMIYCNFDGKTSCSMDSAAL